MVINLGVMWLNNYLYGGKTVATLPFYPPSTVSGLTHRGIEGDDMYQVSPFFITALCGMAFRGLISKFMGIEGPRMPIAH